MAKRSKDRGGSGGIRETKGWECLSSAVKRVVRDIDPLEAIGGRFVTPDLSAGSTVDAEPDRRSRINEVAEVRRPSVVTVVSGGGRLLRGEQPLDGRAKPVSPLLRKAKPSLAKPLKHAGGRIGVSDQGGVADRSSGLKMRDSKPVVMQRNASTKSRIEKALGHCKERPDPDAERRKGSGAGGPTRDYVPWCERKRG